MSSSKYFSFDHQCKPADMRISPADAVRPIACLDGSVADSVMYFQGCWLMKSFEEDGMVCHDSDELMLFFGSDTANHEDLGAEIELWIENDKLTLTDTCVVFIPKGAAHGNMKSTNVSKPILHYKCFMNSGFYNEMPAKAKAAVGMYAGNKVEKYEPVNGYLPPAPEGFLTRLLWIDGIKLQGAPYMEAVWFHTVNEDGPAAHAHEFDEIIGFLGGDPENPEELDAEITLDLDGERVSFTKSCVAYIPRGVMHSPILVPRLNKSLIHFSGGNGGDYIRKDSDNKEVSMDDMYRAKK